MHAPENTLASLREAVSRGAQAVEVDLRRAEDRIWVVFHDRDLRRTVGLKRRLNRTPWETLSHLEAGGWFSPLFRGEKIPRIEQVFEFCRSRKVRVFLDVKESGGEVDLAALLKKPAWSRYVWVGAGTVPALRKWRDLLDENPLFWVTGYRAPVTAARIRMAKRLRLEGLLVYKKWASKRAVRRAHEAGLKLYVWTARSWADLKRLKASGVDGVMNELWPPPSI